MSRSTRAAIPSIPPTLSDAAYLGWVKLPGGPWRAVCGGGDLLACWRRLLAVYERVTCDKAALARGLRP